jgi:hypothetical protein
VHFEDERSGEQITPSPTVYPTLCELIKATESGIQLQLTLNDDGLIMKKLISSAFEGYSLKHPSYISLDEILSGAKPKKSMRLVLCFFLSRAFWHFYGSGWMKKPWTKKDIAFIFDIKSNTPTGIYFHEPYLRSLHLDDLISANNAAQISTTDSSTSDIGGFCLHQFPDILTLGVILLEIELGLRIEDHDPNCYDERGRVNINTTYLTAETIFKERPDLWETSETFPGVKSVIAHCLALHPNGDPFLKFQGKKHKAELRDAIYEYVVGRLQKQCTDTWWADQPDPDTWKASLHPIGGVEGSQPPLLYVHILFLSAVSLLFITNFKAGTTESLHQVQGRPPRGMG